MTKVRRKNLREPPIFDDYWMGLAFWIAAGSKSPLYQQGAVIVSVQGQMLSQGCDSPPKAMKYDGEYFRHAEKVAIQDAKMTIFAGSTIYITHTPCQDCVLDIVSAEIKRLVYYPTGLLDAVAQDIAHQAYLQMVEYKGSLGWMRDHIKYLQSINVFS